MKKKRDLRKEEWEDYIAGLIDGGGSIGEGVIEIRLREGEQSLAYKLKKEVGYGVVKELKGQADEEENGVLQLYRVENGVGRDMISKAINGRLRSEKKVEQLRRSVEWEVRSRRMDGDLNNYWLAGIMDSKGKLEIGLKKREGRQSKSSPDGYSSDTLHSAEPSQSLRRASPGSKGSEV